MTMLNRVAAALLLLVAPANAYDLLSSWGMGGPATATSEHEDPVGRALAGVEVMVFHSCKGRKAIDCKRIINLAHRLNPAAFGGTPKVYYKLERIRDKIDWDDYHPDDLLLYPDYWLIGIRTSYDGTYVAGIDDAGKVRYDYPWCLADDTSTLGYVCHKLGPWNCSGGMTFTECCDFAKADVAGKGIDLVDLHGNVLDCYDSPPPISESDPINYARVKLHVDRGSTVVEAPMNG